MNWDLKHSPDITQSGGGNVRPPGPSETYRLLGCRVAHLSQVLGPLLQTAAPESGLVHLDPISPHIPLWKPRLQGKYLFFLLPRLYPYIQSVFVWSHLLLSSRVTVRKIKEE